MADVLTASAAPLSQAVTLTLIDRAPNGVLVQYTTFDNNKPKTNKNTIYVWEAASDIIPWNGKDPIASQLVSKDQYIGTEEVEFDYQPDIGYIVGYATANDPMTICASLFIPPNGAEEKSKHLTLFSDVKYSSDYVRVRYQTLESYQPNANGNWVGLWKGSHVDMYGNVKPPLTVVPYNNETGSVTIKDGVKIVIGTQYTVGYMMAPWEAGKTSLASSVTFST